VSATCVLQRRVGISNTCKAHLKATVKDNGHIPGSPKKKPTTLFSAEKQAIVRKRKAYGVLAKKHKHFKDVVEAKRLQKMPSFTIDRNGKLGKASHEDQDVHNKVKQR